MNPEAQQFAAGPLTFRLDRDTGFVRDIRFNGREILRGIYPAVRDSHWGTFQPQAEAPHIATTADSVRVKLRARVVGAEMDLSWTAEIEASAGGRISYRWEAMTARECNTNRTGLCVLHPAEAAGAPCTIEHTDGTREAGWFPRDISPHQPFRDIRAITHVLGNRSEATVRMEGEVFEMEDQRNWTDASFKTYCRPLAWARPYVIAPGSRIAQSVLVEVRGALEPQPKVPMETESEPSVLRLPSIGFTLPGPIPSALRERVRALRPGHVRVETSSKEFHPTLEWAGAEAEFLGCRLIVAIRGADKNPAAVSLLPKHYELHLFDKDGNNASAETLGSWAEAGYRHLATGTLHHFTELNRNRPAADGAHELTVFGIAAQVHASDDDSVLETLTQHDAVAEAARTIGAGRPVVVAPISLGAHLDAPDPRLHTDFGARWMLGSLTRLARAGVVSASYFHSHGPAGFLREEVQTPIEQLLVKLSGQTTLPPSLSASP